MATSTRTPLHLKLLVIILATAHYSGVHGEGGIPCAPRNYGRDSFVCVCNATYCDELDKLEKSDPSKVVVFESSKDGKRFEATSITISRFDSTRGRTIEVDSAANADSGHASTTKLILSIDRGTTYQEIVGFGGAFTDAAGININALPADLGAKIVQNYYSSKGIEYTIGRIPIGGSDFSTRKYTYDDNEGDFDLSNFSLAEEDYKHKLPLIKLAINITERDIKFFASAWSAPAWMKTNNDLAGKGGLIGEPGGEYYKTWARYYVKFLEAYQSQGVNVWGLTTGNEPTNGFIPNFSFNCMAFSAETQRDFLKLDLGPTLTASGYGPDKLKIMIMDDQRLMLPKWADVVLVDTNASQYVSGIAFHWYLNGLAPAQLLDLTHNSHPKQFLLSTEACEGSMPFQEKVILGSWARAESYSKDIMEDLLHWTTGWVDWNLALDLGGGPNWAKNFVDAPIIVNATAQEFYKQPMFYALGHFSKFLPPGSRRIGLSSSTACGSGVKECHNQINAIAFEAADNATVVIVLNRASTPLIVTITDPVRNVIYDRTISPNSIATFRN